MDLRKVKKLIELLEDSALVELEITEGDSTIRLSKGASSMVMQPPQQQVLDVPASVEQQAPAQIEPSSDSPGLDTTGQVVESPMVGTFYAAASPDAEPYVTLGQEVKPGDVLCVIEAMKTFNQLEADVEGTVKAIYKGTGDPVEYGEPLFLIG